MKKKLITTAILLTGLLSAQQFNYTFKISDTSLFNNSQPVSNTPTMQDATPQERTGRQSTGEILASDGGVDWYGEVSANDLISGIDLANLVGLTSGTSFNSNIGWLHVGIDGKELYIAKRALRHSISWNNINNANLVYGNRTISINGQDYIIRLLKGANVENVQHVSGYDHELSHGSEWNRIMYRITNNSYLQNDNRKTSEEPFLNLAFYTETDFQLDYRITGNGTANWTQESVIGTSNALYRGARGVSRFVTTQSKSENTAVRGWRPVLEKIN